MFYCTQSMNTSVLPSVLPSALPSVLPRAHYFGMQVMHSSVDADVTIDMSTCYIASSRLAIVVILNF